MPIPAQHQLLDIFRAFLSEAGLSKVSVKNYVSDVRKFIEMDSRLPRGELSARGNDTTNDNVCREANDHVLPSPSAISKFVAALQDSQVPHSTINRYLASLRRYSVFLKVKYEIDTENRGQSTENSATPLTPDPCSLISATFLKSLQNEDLSHSTIKNYKSDLNHFLIWSANTTPSRPSSRDSYSNQSDPEKTWIASSNTPRNDGNYARDEDKTNLADILSPSSLDKYQDHLKIDQTSSSVINRRISTLKKFVKFALVNKLISSDPFQSAIFNVQSKMSNPLAFFRRFTRPFPVIASGTKQSSIQNADGSPRRKYLLAMTSGVRNLTNRIKNNYAYRKYNALPFVPYLHLAILVLFVALLANFGYDQIVTKAIKSQAYPASPTRPTRQLSFQGRLTDSSDTPITVATNVVFKLYNALSGGSQLYTSGTCSVTPDQDGIFNTLIGNTTCGAEIDNTVFSENQGVYMEVAVGATTLTPRQQIATVGYALNTETLQGYPISSTASATKSTVAVMNQYGEVILGEQSPVLKSVSGTFTLQGQTLSLSTASTTNGNINLAPDGTGSINAIGGATSGNFLRITDANLTSGNLISGYVGNNTATGNLLSLSSGSSETTRLAVGAFGQTTLDAAGKGKSALIVNQIDSGPIFAASASGTNRFLITNAGNITLNQATIIDSTGTLSLNTTNNQAITTGTGITTLGGNLVLNNSASTTTFGGLAYTWPSSQTSNYVLATNGSGTLSWNDASVLTGGTVYWNQANGSLFPKNSTVDAFIGGQATASAKFAFLNVNSGTPTASISGNSAGRALVIDGLGNITTTAMSPITIGSASTGPIALNPKGTTGLYVDGTGQVGIGTVSPDTKLFVQTDPASTNSILDVATLARTTTGTAASGLGSRLRFVLEDAGANLIDTGGVSSYWVDPAIGVRSANTQITSGLGNSSVTVATFTSAGNVGIGTTGPDNTLDIVGTLDVSGTTEFNNIAYTWPATQTNTYILQTNGSGTLSWVDPNIAAASTIYWNQANGSLFPKNSTVDAFIGGQATASAKFAFLNVNSGTPTASISGTANRSLVLDAFGNITTTAKQSLTLGDASTGNIILNAGNVGVGTTSPLQTLHIAGQCVTGDTLLKRRKRRKNRPRSGGVTGGGNDPDDEDWEWEDVRIDEIEEGDEILTLDEKTGKFITSKVNGLMEMGIQETYLLITESGKQIRTTSEHPYLVRKSDQATIVGGVYQVDQSSRIENLSKDSYIALANKNLNFVIKISKEYKKSVYKQYQSQNKLRFFAPDLFAKAINTILISQQISPARLEIDHEYSGSESRITQTIKLAKPHLDIEYQSIGHSSSSWAHWAAYQTFKGKIKPTLIVTENKKDRGAIKVVGLGAVTLIPLNQIRNTRDLLQAQEYPKTSDLSRNTKWIKVHSLSPGMQIAVAPSNNNTPQPPLNLRGGRSYPIGGVIDHHAIAGGIQWETIVVLKKYAREQVYDIEVEGTHNFVGNGIVAHNTYINSTANSASIKGLEIAQSGAVTGTGYGLYAAKTGASTTNVGGYFSASGATNNYGLIVENGNVGIGTTGPGAKLEVSNSGTSELRLTGTTASQDAFLTFYHDGTRKAYVDVTPTIVNVWAQANVPMAFGTNNAERVRIDSSGNVGIGTTGPGYKLDVTGDIRATTTITGATLTDGYITLNSAQINRAGATVEMQWDGASGSDVRIFGNTAFPVVFKATSGNVGIGTTAPGAKLDVAGGDILLDASKKIYGETTGTAGSFASIELYNAATGNMTLRTDYSTAGIAFQTGTGGNDRVFIKSDGNVGIGTTAPGTKLEIYGSSNNAGIKLSGSYSNPALDLSGTFAWGGTSPLVNLAPTFSAGVSSNNQVLDVSPTLGGTAGNITGVNVKVLTPGAYSANNYYGVYVDAAGATTNYGLYVNRGTTVLGATSGNVGIGTTAPSAKLHVAGNCVTGDTLLPIKRRKKRSRNKFGMTGGGDGDDDMDSLDDFDELLCPIRDIQPDDQVLSLNEATGTLEYSKINKLMDMGIKQVYELTTKSGRIIRTTAAHPFLTLMTA